MHMKKSYSCDNRCRCKKLVGRNMVQERKTKRGRKKAKEKRESKNGDSPLYYWCITWIAGI